MRILFSLVIAVALLAGCVRKEEAATTTVEGRYQGVGVYGVGPGWARITVPPAQEGSRAARLADDDHVIVVSDSQTGEVRQCGDLSGYCITLNPWKGALDATRAAPVSLEPLRDENGKVVERPDPANPEETAAAR
jgi:hypothetical protein